jgi:hypothetical protein
MCCPKACEVTCGNALISKKQALSQRKLFVVKNGTEEVLLQTNAEMRVHRRVGSLVVKTALMAKSPTDIVLGATAGSPCGNASSACPEDWCAPNPEGCRRIRGDLVLDDNLSCCSRPCQVSCDLPNSEEQRAPKEGDPKMRLEFGSQCEQESASCSSSVPECAPAPEGCMHGFGDLVIDVNGSCCPQPCKVKCVFNTSTESTTAQPDVSTEAGRPCEHKSEFCTDTICSPAPEGCRHVDGDLVFSANGSCCPRPCQVECGFPIDMPESLRTTIQPDQRAGRPCEQESEYCPDSTCAPAPEGCRNVPGELVIIGYGMCCPKACEVTCGNALLSKEQALLQRKLSVVKNGTLGSGVKGVGARCEEESTHCPEYSWCTAAPVGCRNIPGNLVTLLNGSCCPQPCHVMCEASVSPGRSLLEVKNDTLDNPVGIPCENVSEYCPMLWCSTAPEGCWDVPGDLVTRQDGSCCTRPCQVACEESVIEEIEQSLIEEASTDTLAAQAGTPCESVSQYCPEDWCAAAPEGCMRIVGDLVTRADGSCCPRPCQLACYAPGSQNQSIIEVPNDTQNQSIIEVRNDTLDDLLPESGTPCENVSEYCPVAQCAPAPEGCRAIHGELVIDASGSCCPMPCQVACGPGVKDHFLMQTRLSISSKAKNPTLKAGVASQAGSMCETMSAACPTGRCAPAPEGCMHIPGNLTINANGSCCPRLCQVRCVQIVRPESTFPQKGTPANISEDRIAKPTDDMSIAKPEDATSQTFDCQTPDVPYAEWNAFWNVAQPCTSIDLIKVLTYQLFWEMYSIGMGIGDGSSQLLVEKGPFDLIAFQECDDVDSILDNAGLNATYAAITAPHGLAIAYNKAVWSELSRGTEDVADDYVQPGELSPVDRTWGGHFGLRAVSWARLTHILTGKVVFFTNYHGPLPMDTGGRCGEAATAHHVLQVFYRNAQASDLKILAGDLNAGVQSFTQELLSMHMHRAATDGVDAIFTSRCESNHSYNDGRNWNHNALEVDIRL